MPSEHMPKDCKHRVRVLGERDEVACVLAAVRGTPGTPNECFDLNSIVPVPESIKRLLWLSRFEVVRRATRDERAFAEHRRLEEAARAAAWLETGVEHWGEWARAEWGANSNVYAVERAEDEDTLYFSTEWSPVIPALVALSAAFPRVTIEIAFADVEGYVLGEGVLKAGKRNIRQRAAGTRAGRRLYEQFWGEWPGGRTGNESGVIDLTHKRAD